MRPGFETWSMCTVLFNLYVCSVLNPWSHPMSNSAFKLKKVTSSQCSSSWRRQKCGLWSWSGSFRRYLKHLLCQGWQNAFGIWWTCCGLEGMWKLWESSSWPWLLAWELLMTRSKKLSSCIMPHWISMSHQRLMIMTSLHGKYITFLIILICIFECTCDQSAYE